MPQTVMAPVTGRGDPAGESSERGDALLCIANFPANTGYAWDFIETLYARLADRLAPRGVRTWVAYPDIDLPPRTLVASAAKAIQLDVKLNRFRSVWATMRFVQRHRVRVVYLADRPVWHPAYKLLRWAGVRRIVVHDHTSGARTVPRGLKRLVKLSSRRLLPGMLADVVLGVSDFVARRKIDVDLAPPARVRRVWNSLDVPAPNPRAGRVLRDAFGLSRDTLVVICACRAVREKGIEILLRAFDRLEIAETRNVALIYLGEGPDFLRLCSVRESLHLRDRVVFGGFRSDAGTLIEGADVCVVPSVWEEAFGLAALEPMARGVPVIASRVGGVPEIVVDGVTGLLVPPADDAALANALSRLIADDGLRTRLGVNGRRRAEACFSMNREINELAELVEPSFV